jgi:phosphohistidine phosphatase
VKLYILRHGTAEPRAKGVAEATRELTPEGKRELKRVLKRASAAGIAPKIIFTSPWTRALDSARLARKTLKSGELVQSKNLLPDTPPEKVWNEIRARNGTDEVMIAGHEPQLTRLAAFLLEAPVAMDLKKGGLVRIDVQAREGPPRGILKWMLTPGLAVK